MAKLNMVRDGHLGGYVPGGDPGTWCPRLWQWLVEEFGIRSVLDIGCGEGHSTNFFRDLGCRVLGVEGCAQAIRDSVIPECVVQHDFNQGPYLPPAPFDLVWSCEFLEHVDEAYLPNILGTFAHAERALFVTHAFPRQRRGHHHVNCRPSSYWIRHFERLGFTCSVAASREARTMTLADYEGINHFARSGLVFLKNPGRELAPDTMWSRLASNCQSRLKSWAINQVFRWSGDYRRHRKARKLWKRSAGRVASDE